MNVNKQKLLTPLLLVITLLLAAPAPAHDFPDASSVASERLTSECSNKSKNSKEHDRKLMQRQFCPFAFSSSSFSLWSAYGKSLVQSLKWQNGLSRLAGEMETLHSFFCAAPSVESDLPAADARELWVATPIKGEAPAPAETLHVAQAEIVVLGHGKTVAGKRQFIENYMPYDLSIRDWRFGQFPIEKNPTVERNQAARAETEADSEFSYAATREASKTQVGNSARWSRLVQRVVTLGKKMRDQFSNLESLGNWSAQTTILRQLALKESLRRAGQYVAANSVFEDRAPLFKNPQFVIYHDAAGTSIVLTAEQAREWNLDAQPTLAVEQVAFASGSVFPFVRKGTDQLLNALSARLESAGSALIATSHVIRTLTGSRIAENNSSDLR